MNRPLQLLGLFGLVGGSAVGIVVVAQTVGGGVVEDEPAADEEVVAEEEISSGELPLWVHSVEVLVPTDTRVTRAEVWEGSILLTELAGDPGSGGPQYPGPLEEWEPPEPLLAALLADDGHSDIGSAIRWGTAEISLTMAHGAVPESVVEQLRERQLAYLVEIGQSWMTFDGDGNVFESSVQGDESVFAALAEAAESEPIQPVDAPRDDCGLVIGPLPSFPPGVGWPPPPELTPAPPPQACHSPIVRRIQRTPDTLTMNVNGVEVDFPPDTNRAWFIPPPDEDFPGQGAVDYRSIRLGGSWINFDDGYLEFDIRPEHELQLADVVNGLEFALGMSPTYQDAGFPANDGQTIEVKNVQIVLPEGARMSEASGDPPIGPLDPRHGGYVSVWTEEWWVNFAVGYVEFPPESGHLSEFFPLLEALSISELPYYRE